MQYSNLDTEIILSCSQQWLELNRKWGEPVDLEVVDSGEAEGRRVVASRSSNVVSGTTFDSARLIRKLKQTKEATRCCCHDSRNDYNFTERISSNDTSAGRNTLVENICREIDAILPRISSGVSALKRAVDLATLQQDYHEKTCDGNLEAGVAKNLVMQEVDQISASEISESSLSSLSLSMEDGEGYSADVESFDDSKFCSGIQ